MKLFKVEVYTRDGLRLIEEILGFESKDEALNVMSKIDASGNGTWAQVVPYFENNPSWMDGINPADTDYEGLHE